MHSTVLFIKLLSVIKFVKEKLQLPTIMAFLFFYFKRGNGFKLGVISVIIIINLAKSMNTHRILDDTRYT